MAFKATVREVEFESDLHRQIVMVKKRVEMYRGSLARAIGAREEAEAREERCEKLLEEALKELEVLQKEEN